MPLFQWTSAASGETILSYDELFGEIGIASPEFRCVIVALLTGCLFWAVGKSKKNRASDLESKHKKLAAEDWTLAGMTRRWIVANGGKPLSAAEEAEVKAVHDKIAAAQKTYEGYVAKAEADAAERREQALDAEGYSLAKMMAARASAGGRELTAAEIEKVKAQHDEIVAAQKALDEYVAEKTEFEREQAFDEVCERIEEEVRQEVRTFIASADPSDPDFGTRNKLFTKEDAEAALARLKKMLSRTNGGVDPAKKS
jgi:uncharacterized cupredoxin-like copper-binding protein